MRFLNYSYLIYGLLGIVGGITNLFTDVDAITKTFASGNKFPVEYLIIIKAFGSAVLALGLLSAFTFFVKDQFAKIGLTFILTYFNLATGYLGLTIENIPYEYVVYGYIHVFLGLLYGVMGLLLLKKR